MLYTLVPEEQLQDKEFSMAPVVIKQHQDVSFNLKKQVKQDKNTKHKFIAMSIEGVDLLLYNGKIRIPNSLSD